jgi:nitrate/TMAO reductase-like tetraheme cytochrome c subunit
MPPLFFPHTAIQMNLSNFQAIITPKIAYIYVHKGKEKIKKIKNERNRTLLKRGKLHSANNSFSCHIYKIYIYLLKDLFKF